VASTRTFRGLFAIPVTPFDEDGQIDEPSLHRVIHFCVESGAHGIVTPVNVSEFTTLSIPERKLITRVAVREAGGAVPVVIGVFAVFEGLLALRSPSFFVTQGGRVLARLSDRSVADVVKRQAMRAGLAMYFVTLDDEELMRTGNLIVAELGIEHFFNIQLVGEHVIEINPRISTIVYQEDFNLPYLGVKRALGEISDDELRSYASRIRPGRTALRYFDQLEFDT